MANAEVPGSDAWKLRKAMQDGDELATALATAADLMSRGTPDPGDVTAWTDSQTLSTAILARRPPP